MKNYAIKTSLAMVIALASCKDEIDQSPVDLLTIEVVDESFLCCDLEAWVYVTNSDGDVLDVTQLTVGEIDTLRGVNSSGEVSLTIFRHYTNVNNIFSLETYAAIAKGSKLKFGFKNPTPPEPPLFSGYANFEIKNYRAPTDSPYSLEFSDGTVNAFAHGTVDNGVYRTQRVLYSPSVTEMIAGYRDGVPVYALVKNIKNNDVIKLDYDTDFKPHEKVVDLGLTTASGVLYGRYNTDRLPGAARVLGSTNPLEGTMLPRKIGYIDGFDSYYSIMFNRTSVENFVYTRTGTPVPTNFTWPAYGVTITNKALPVPQFTTATKFAACSMNLQGFYGPPADNIYIVWFIHGATNADLKVVNVPDELKAKYPRLDVNSLPFSSLRLLVTPDQYTYQNFIADQFSGSATKTTLSEVMEYYKY